MDTLIARLRAALRALPSGPWSVESLRPGREDEARIYDLYGKGVAKLTTGQAAPHLRGQADALVALHATAMELAALPAAPPPAPEGAAARTAYLFDKWGDLLKRLAESEAADTLAALRAEVAQLRAQLAAAPSLEAREQAIDLAFWAGSLDANYGESPSADMANARRLLGLPVKE